MIDGLKPYPAYKDSGVPWLGAIPEHWEVRPLKRWIQLNPEVLSENTAADYEFRYIDIGGVGTGALVGNPQTLRFGSAPSRARRVIRRGDTIVSTVRTYLKAVFYVDGNADHLICSTGFCVLRPRLDTVPRFLRYVIECDPFTDRITANSVGIAYPAIPEGRFGSFKVPIPSFDEQAAIAQFLQNINSRIGRYIRAKKKLIALLNEQKQAIIHRAVTRGLDPNVRLKPSGVEWLGDVPEDWRVMRVRTLVRRINQGVSPQAEAGLAGDAAWGVLKAGCVNHGVFRDTVHKRLPVGFAVDESIAVRIGDVLVCRASGSPKLVGSVGRVDSLRYRLILSDKVFRLVIRDERLLTFIVAAMSTPYFRIQVEQAISGAEGLANNLPLSALKDFRVAIPPPSEAQQIAAELRSTTAHIDSLRAHAERELSALREYRTRLIADVVTGKLDVREAAARLPDEVEDAQTAEPIEGADALTDRKAAEEDSEAASEEALEEALA